MAAAELLDTIPLDDERLDRSEIDYWQLRLSDLVQDSGVERRLRLLHLPGVIERHTLPKDGSWPPERGLHAAQAAMAEGAQHSFLLIERATGYLAGMASIQPALDLRLQPFPLPAKLARRVPWLSVSALGDDPKKWANFAAWIDPNVPDQEGCLRQTYGELRSRIPDDKMPWTVLPRRIIGSDAGDYDFALRSAGFVLRHCGRYDDMEDRWRVPPQMRQYTLPLESELAG